MLLRISTPLARRPESAARPQESAPRRDEGQPHHCGLRHRSECEGWSGMSAILWWLLRANR